MITVNDRFQNPKTQERKEMNTKAELQKKIGGLSQKIAGLRGEMESLRGEEKSIRARLVASKVADGKVETAANEAAHNLRENLTRQDVTGEALALLENQINEAQRELDDLLLAETSLPWQELEAELWPAVAAMQKQIAEMNRKLLSLFARANQAPAVTPDAVPLKYQIPIALQTANSGMYQAWQALESINQRSPHPVSWPGSSDEVPGFGKKL
jgi:chromosome segregation ATPase